MWADSMISFSLQWKKNRLIGQHIVPCKPVDIHLPAFLGKLKAFYVGFVPASTLCKGDRHVSR